MALYTKATDVILDYLMSDKTAFKRSKLFQMNSIDAWSKNVSSTDMHTPLSMYNFVFSDSNYYRFVNLYVIESFFPEFV